MVRREFGRGVYMRKILNKTKIQSMFFLVLLLFCIPIVAHAGNAMVGAGLYSKHCAKCHGGNGRAVMAGTPDLLVHNLISKPAPQLLDTIKTGRGIMPAYAGLLTEDQMFDILAYLRTFF